MTDPMTSRSATRSGSPAVSGTARRAGRGRPGVRATLAVVTAAALAFSTSPAHATTTSPAPAIASTAVRPAEPARTVTAAAGSEFESSFETGDPVPEVSMPLTEPVNFTGRSFGPGSLLGAVAEVTASAENAPGEPAASLADANSSTKWLAFQRTGWAQYRLTSAQTVAAYSLTSANDSDDRDPKSWTIQGSPDGTTWTTVDSRTDQAFPDRFATKQYTVATPAAYLYYRLDITANNGGAILQLADWEILDGSTGVPAPSPMVSAVGAGPVSGPTVKSGVGFSGLKALRYAGSPVADGPASATDVLFQNLDLTVGADTELAYKIFPVLEGGDLTWAATFTAVDLQLDDGTLVSADALVDQYGFPASAQGQGTSKVLYGNQWNAVRVDLGSLAGKHISKILLSYDFPDAKAGRSTSGWIDDLAIAAADQLTTPDGLVDHVDTRRGTNANSNFSRGNNIPAAAVPNGFNFYTPMTDAGSQSWLYKYAEQNNAANRPMLNALGISHEPSPWMGDRNQLAFMPSLSTEAAPSGDLNARKLAFTHDSEIARPDLYQVAFDNGLLAKIAPADHAAVYSFTAPATADSQSVIIDRVDGSSKFTRDGTGVSGWVENGSGLSAGRTRMYFVADFDATPVSSAVTSARTSGLAVRFDTSTDKTVEMRVATSFLSTAQARHNLDLEVAGRSFEEVRHAATDAWNSRLGAIEAPQATPAQEATLYSNLYRLNLYPNSQSENTGTQTAPEWMYASPVTGPVGDAGDTVSNATVVPGQIYVNNGFWDTYRTVWPLYSFLYPDFAAKLVNGFVQQYRDGGWIARWSSPGYADLMTGTSSDASFAEAYVSGALPTPIALEAYDAALKNATVLPTSNAVGRKGLDTSPFLGYTSTATGESVSWGLEGYINDYAVGQMGAALAADPATPQARRSEIKESAAYLTKRAQDYVNMFDPEIDFFQGRTASGGFAKSPEQFDPTSWGGDYTETNGWNFAFHTPYDVAGLEALYGSRTGLLDKLDAFFALQETGSYGIHEAKEARDVRLGQFGMSNQVSHHIPWMYAAAGAPSGTQRITREIVDRLFVGSEIGQGYPGDEDNGEMSSWYLFAAMGFYPLSLASGEYVVGSPLFDKTVVHRQSKGTLTIDAPQNTRTTPYVKSLSLNGTPVTEAVLQQSALTDGANLTFGMSAEPSNWGAQDTAAAPRTPLIDVSGPATGELTVSDGTAARLIDTAAVDADGLTDDNSRSGVTFDTAAPTLDWASSQGPVAVTTYTLTGAATGDAPSAWTLEGSNDGDSWTALDNRSDQDFRWATQTRAFSIADPTLFTRYRLHVTATGGAGSPSLAEFELLADPNRQTDELTLFPATVRTTSTDSSSRAWAVVKGGSNDPADYTATVDFQDGAGPQPATVSRARVGGVSISASHRFPSAGTYSVRIAVSTRQGDQVVDVGGVATAIVSLDMTLLGNFDLACMTVPGVAVDCDGNGWGLNRNALRDKGFIPGESIPLGDTGLTADIPLTAAGEPDNLSAGGQTVGVDLGKGATRLSLLGFANEGAQSGGATITYTDGTTQSFTLGFGDWVGAANAPITGSQVLLTTTGRLRGTDGSDTLTTGIYYLDPITLEAGKTVSTLTMPNLDHSVNEGQLHILAVASDGVRSPSSRVLTTAREVAEQIVGDTFSAELATVSGGRPTGGYVATVNWGDDGPVDVSTTGADGVVTGSHQYRQPGRYAVRIAATDGLTSSAAQTTITVSQNDPSPAITLTPGSRKPGETFTVTGTGFTAGERVDVKLDTTRPVVRTVTSTAGGTFSLPLTVPATAMAGSYPVKAFGSRSQTVATAELTVVIPRVSPRLALSVTPTTAPLGATVSLTATADKGVIGGVEFLDGTRTLGVVTLSASRATLRVSTLGVGTHRITARFLGDERYLPQTTPAKSVTVTKKKVTLSAPTTSRTQQVWGSSSVATLSTVVTGQTHGRVTFRSGSTVLGQGIITARQGGGSVATLALSRTTPVGRYTSITATLAAGATTAMGTSRPGATVTVVKATPQSIRVTGSTFRTGTRPVVDVSVGTLTNGSRPSGRVEIFESGRRVAVVTLTARGTARATLPVSSRPVRVQATFTPTDSTHVAGKTSAVVVIRSR
ncbi:GH92 family glycosyl hydrolase [Nakamurella sp. A5-74]|uniref:GH92 family glycosyl hydrolase n=1 Tax=Nakamurella sp. A5-74 TaxID=3158264 RepID=A0AAU8DR14_9ACTN